MTPRMDQVKISQTCSPSPLSPGVEPVMVLFPLKKVVSHRSLAAECFVPEIAMNAAAIPNAATTAKVLIITYFWKRPAFSYIDKKSLALLFL